MSLNVIHLVGRVGRDPDPPKYFESGSVLCELTMAVNRPTKRDDRPDWFNLKMWGKTAEFAANYIRKGRLIGVQGSLVIETWNDPNTGAHRSKPVILVNRLDLLDSKRDAEAAAMNSYSDGEF